MPGPTVIHQSPQSNHAEAHGNGIHLLVALLVDVDLSMGGSEIAKITASGPARVDRPGGAQRQPGSSAQREVSTGAGGTVARIRDSPVAKHDRNALGKHLQAPESPPRLAAPGQAD